MNKHPALSALIYKARDPNRSVGLQSKIPISAAPKLSGTLAPMPPASNVDPKFVDREFQIDPINANSAGRDAQGHAILCALLAMAMTAIACVALRLNQKNGELQEQVRSLEEMAGLADPWTHGRVRRP